MTIYFYNFYIHISDLRTALFWVSKQRVVVIPCPRFGTRWDRYFVPKSR